MAEKVILSSLGVEIEEANIVELKFREGDIVKKDEEIAVVETQKVTFPIVSPVEGKILKLLVKEGDTVKVNQIIAIIGKEGEDISEFIDTDEEKKDSIEVKKAFKKPNNKKVKIFPAVRRMAEEQNVDLSKIEGTGTDGLITKSDVLNFIKDNKDNKEDKEITLKGIRRTIALRMKESLDKAAHVTSVIEIDMEEIKKYRQHIKESKGIKVSYLPFFIKAAIRAINNVPIINSVIEKDKIIVKKNINFSIAVSTDDGLQVPVIKNINDMDLLEINSKINLVSKLAKNKKLNPEDSQGGTITLSNGGSFGPIINTPIINQPQVAIIWTGKIIDRPVVYKGEIAIRSTMYLCLSYDHRAMDGKDASEFLVKIKQNLEKAAEFLI